MGGEQREVERAAEHLGFVAGCPAPLSSTEISRIFLCTGGLRSLGTFVCYGSSQGGSGASAEWYMLLERGGGVREERECGNTKKMRLLSIRHDAEPPRHHINIWNLSCTVAMPCQLTPFTLLPFFLPPTHPRFVGFLPTEAGGKRPSGRAGPSSSLRWQRSPSRSGRTAPGTTDCVLHACMLVVAEKSDRFVSRFRVGRTGGGYSKEG